MMCDQTQSQSAIVSLLRDCEEYIEHSHSWTAGVRAEKRAELLSRLRVLTTRLTHADPNGDTRALVTEEEWYAYGLEGLERDGWSEVAK